MNISEFRAQYPQYDDMSDTELAAALHGKHFADMPKYEFDKMFIGRPTHDNLDTAAVTAQDSLEIQKADPEIKPVIVGTPQEILQMKKAGELGKGKELFMAKGKAYVIDPKGVQAIYGASMPLSVKLAKIDLLKGNDSRLLGYPSREGDTVDFAVDKQGQILTDLPQISDAAKAGEVAYAAEGAPDAVPGIAEKVSQAVKKSDKWKTIGGPLEPGE